MALVLTCACGARFELEDSLADQTIPCPECQQQLKAPSIQAAGVARRTNLLALLSVVVALLGAFTPLVGQVAAIVLGILALTQIKRHPDREAGAGLAFFGIGSGVVFGAMMVFSFFVGDLFGLASWWREKTLDDHVDVHGPLEYADQAKGFAITRPSRGWGVAVSPLEDPIVKALSSHSTDLVLVNLNRQVFIDIQAESGNFRSLQDWEDSLLEELRSEDLLDLGNPNRPRKGNPRQQPQFDFPQGQPKLDEATLQRRRLEVAGGKAKELEMDVLVSNQRWHMMVRLFQSDPGKKCYIVRAYAPRHRTFKAIKPDIDAILDSFKFLPTKR